MRLGLTSCTQSRACAPGWSGAGFLLTLGAGKGRLAPLAGAGRGSWLYPETSGPFPAAGSQGPAQAAPRCARRRWQAPVPAPRARRPPALPASADPSPRSPPSMPSAQLLPPPGPVPGDRAVRALPGGGWPWPRPPSARWAWVGRAAGRGPHFSDGGHPPRRRLAHSRCSVAQARHGVTDPACFAGAGKGAAVSGDPSLSLNPPYTPPIHQTFLCDPKPGVSRFPGGGPLRAPETARSQRSQRSQEPRLWRWRWGHAGPSPSLASHPLHVHRLRGISSSHPPSLSLKGTPLYNGGRGMPSWITVGRGGKCPSHTEGAQDMQCNLMMSWSLGRSVLHAAWHAEGAQG